ncbi:hypothetical protein ACFYW9_34430 [Streptomyces sp. NPDC002698]|uniref:hypothetical protein n=1 Tax=Streptomyces sp. NPDC002698 TaxID=3364660 RepID=UPI0036BB2B6C
MHHRTARSETALGRRDCGMRAAGWEDAKRISTLLYGESFVQSFKRLASRTAVAFGLGVATVVSGPGIASAEVHPQY